MKKGPEKREPTIELEPEQLFSVEQATSASAAHPDRNEDMILGAEHPELAAKLEARSVYGAFDGVSRANGADASREANAVAAAYLAELSPNADARESERALKNALLAADAALGHTGKKGTTADLIRIIENDDGSQEMAWAHIGDSRIMVLDGKTQELRTLTIDHGLAGAALKGIAGNALPEISREEYDQVMSAESEAELAPHLKMLYAGREAVYATLGHKDRIPPDHGIEPLTPGSKVLISTDGIHDNLTPQELTELLQNDASMEEIRKKAYARAEAKAMLDNLKKIEESLKKDGNLRKNADLTPEQLALYQGLGSRENILKAQAQLVNQDAKIGRGKRDDITGVLVKPGKGEAPARPERRERATPPPLPPEVRKTPPPLPPEVLAAKREEDQNGLDQARKDIREM
jgi:serine/threonine protein phosphatase PrpC